MFMALGALVIIAVLIAAWSFVTLQESQAGQNQLVAVPRVRGRGVRPEQDSGRTGTRRPTCR